MLRKWIAETKSAGYSVRNSFNLLLLIFLILVISSCATVPPEKPPSTWFSLLPDQSSLYIFIPQPEEIRSLVPGILTMLQLSIPDSASLLKKTKEAYGAVRIRENEPPLYSLVLIGTYSSCSIGFGLAVSKQWKKDPETNTFWLHKRNGIMLSQPDPYMLLMTNDDMKELLQSRLTPHEQNVPDTIKNSLEHNACTLFFPDFSKEMIPEEIPVNKKKLPVKEAMISINSQQDTYELLASFNLIETKNALLFSTSFKTFLIWLMRHGKIDKFTTRIKVDAREEFVHAFMTDFTEPEITRALNVLLSAKETLSGGKDH